MSDKEKPVLFYGFKSGQKYGCFSNFYPASFTLDEKLWPTTEHYFMAQKTLNPEKVEKIRRADGPREARRLGRIVELRPNWDNIKYNIMVKALHAKFTQNEHICEILLSTGDRSIHENCKDPWWGGGPNFPGGRDLLGKALIEVRTLIKTVNSLKEK
ncbi:Swarming motility protein ybiA [Candidatus Pacearchaeota archaeon]|nr:Swarming motility protein ybiA [Candidatus Pacearchaeota archaeon]|tara:strand:+ start:240 stop:710 length:471 start_codon:yes stop_codon:yes gene_type:complete